MQSIEKIREQFPVTENKTFLNHAAQSSIPRPVSSIICKYINDFSKFGTTSIEWNDGGKPYFAKLIGSKTEEIAFVESTSVGLNIVANMLHYPTGSKIVTTDLEYPSVVYPWLRKNIGVKVQYVENVNGKILLEDVEKAVDDNTVAVAISHVEYVNGFRHSLQALSEIAHEHGAYLIVDVIQSCGAMQINVKKDNVDFLTSACYKWLLAPPGAGYLCVKDELVTKFEPPFVGWASVDEEVFETIDFWDIWSLRLSNTAKRFQVGTPSFISLVGATESLKLLLNYGIKSIERRILKLTSHLIDAVKDLGLELQTPEELQYRSGIVNFKIGEPEKIVEKLKKKGIIVSARANGIRISPHFYNTEREVEVLIEEIKQYS